MGPSAKSSSRSAASSYYQPPPSRSDRARSIAHLYAAAEAVATNYPPRSSYATTGRNSVGRYGGGLSSGDEYYYEPTTTASSRISGRASQPRAGSSSSTSAAKKKSQTPPDFDKRSDIEKRMSLASESSVTPTPENLD